MHIHSRYAYEEVDINVGNFSILEQIWINIKYKKNSLLVGIIYRPPYNNITNCIKEFDNVMSRIVPIYEKIIITGDMNINFFNLSNLNVLILKTCLRL